MRDERPCSRCAAKQCDELASPHGHSLGARITPYHIVEKLCCASQHFCPPHCRSGSKREYPACRPYVRSRQVQTLLALSSTATRRHLQRKSPTTHTRGAEL